MLLADKGWRVGFGVVAVFVVGLVATSGRSLWIDEAATAVQAMQPDLSSWWQLLVQEKTAHLQMPLYMLYIWAYEKVFGSGEWTLRLANLPVFVAGATVFVASFQPEHGRRSVAAYLTLFCPFAWYYLDEARPYGMELGASLLVVGSLRHLTQTAADAADGANWHLAGYIIGLVVLCGSSLLGMVWAGAALVVLPVLLRKPQLAALCRANRGLCLMAGGILTVLAAYYLWTLKIGARATAPTASSWGSTMFVGYELLGFGGIGPPRLELRSAGLAALRGYLPWLILFGVANAAVVGMALWRGLATGRRQYLLLVLCVAVPAAFILGTGWLAHFRVLGRHFAPVMPVLLVAITYGLCALWAKRSVWARGMVLLYCALCLVSCLSLRFSPHHQKDNYRAAAAAAKAALGRGEVVWWSAAVEGARYYGVPLVNQPGTNGAALLVANPVRGTLNRLPMPQVVVASKPDVYDSQGTLAKYLGERLFVPVERLAAFVVWGRSKP